MTKHRCTCGKVIFLTNYKIHLEGSITFRDYSSICKQCGAIIKTRDLNEDDLKEQKYMF